MAKRGYKCQCGWRLNRGKMTRRSYADVKVEHARTCVSLREELRNSGKIVTAAETEVEEV